MFQLEAQLSDRNITIELTPEANQWLAERGYDDKFGARPLSRVIQEHIKKPLAEEILFGALKDGGIVRVLVEEKAGEKVLGFEYIKPDAPIRPRDPEDTEPNDEGPDGGGGGAKVATKTGAAKPRAKRGPRKPRGGRQRSRRLQASCRRSRSDLNSDNALDVAHEASWPSSELIRSNVASSWPGTRASQARSKLQRRELVTTRTCAAPFRLDRSLRDWRLRPRRHVRTRRMLAHAYRAA